MATTSSRPAGTQTEAETLGKPLTGDVPSALETAAATT
jgi:hypothetical protein